MERACDVLQLDQHQSLRGLYHYRCQSDRSVVFNPVREGCFFFSFLVLVYKKTWEGVLYWGCNFNQHIWGIHYDTAPKSFLFLQRMSVDHSNIDTTALK